MSAIPPQARAWIEGETGLAIVAAVGLDEATTASMHRVDFAEGGSMVSKRFDRQDALDERPHRALHEATVLELLAPTPVPAPHLIAVDGTGEEAGAPTVLMSWIEGSTRLPERWVGAIAANLMDIHRVEPGGIAWPYERYNRGTDLVVPSWAGDPALWEEAFAIAADPPATAHGFIHRDYHGGNLLWHGGRLIGVLDWLSGCVGPLAIDLAHLRTNLAMDVGFDAADAILAEYGKSGLSDAWHPAWDVVDGIDFLPFWLGPQAVEEWRWDHRPIEETQQRFDRILGEAVRRNAER